MLSSVFPTPARMPRPGVGGEARALSAFVSFKPATAGCPGGNVGSLIVGAAEGLGGKLIRTVSFFGFFPRTSSSSSGLNEMAVLFGGRGGG
jgi:hypothetical protein